MSNYKAIKYTQKTPSGLTVELVAECRRYWRKDARWSVIEYDIFGACAKQSRIAAFEVRKLKEAFIAKYN